MQQKQKNTVAADHLARIKRNRFYTRMLAYLVGVGGLGNAAPVTKAEPGSLPLNEDGKEMTYAEYNLNKISTLIKNIDIDKEIENRANWFVGKYLDELNNQYEGVLEAKAADKNTKGAPHKKQFVKENILDVVTNGKGNKSDPYCIAGALAPYFKVNRDNGDLDGILPEADENGNTPSKSCPNFAGYMKNLFPKLVQRNVKNLLPLIEKTKPGTIFIVKWPNGASGKHALIRLDEKDENGNVLFMSNNNESKKPLSAWKFQGNVSGDVIEMPKIIVENWKEKAKGMNKIEFIKNIHANRTEDLIQPVKLSINSEIPIKEESRSAAPNTLALHQNIKYQRD